MPLLTTLPEGKGGSGGNFGREAKKPGSEPHSASRSAFDFGQLLSGP